MEETEDIKEMRQMMDVMGEMMTKLIRKIFCNETYTRMADGHITYLNKMTKAGFTKSEAIGCLTSLNEGLSKSMSSVRTK